MTLTIIEAASDKRLTTLPTAKAELQVTSGADDAYITSLIDQASAAVLSWCQRAFAAETVRETFRLPAPDTSIMLARWPVLSAVSIEINGQTEDADNAEPEAGGFLYRLNDDGNRVSWPSGRIVIEYRAGFVLPNDPGRTLPADIERAALSLVKAGWFARSRDPLIRSETIEGAGSTDYFSGTVSRLPPDVESLLSPYRNLTMG
ncbi:MAG: phage head-tail connector protein [Mesorhizobium sp.]|nr:hypothetical protein [Mesorhizobium sp.]MBN9241906.1 phage head-tail connector protein [Mesorhizobium sp.]